MPTSELGALKQRGDERVVLLLQGGGALGAYHVGAYEALHECGIEPDWVIGISIGAFTAALIAGNKPADRLPKLTEFWERISRPSWPSWPRNGTSEFFLQLANSASVMTTMMFGQPNFFRPRLLNPYFAPPGPLAQSFYEASSLRTTLLDLVDFGAINDGASGSPRLSLGATRIDTGEIGYFDSRPGRSTNAKSLFGTSIIPESVMASGAIPPGFPPVTIDGVSYWDGCCVSNTPLTYFQDEARDADTTVIMLDLWGLAGSVPQTIDQVYWRQKRIQYGSRIVKDRDAVLKDHSLRLALKASDDAQTEGRATKLKLYHITYEPTEDQVSMSDAEFSRTSIERRRAAGKHAMSAALAAPAGQRDAAPGKDFTSPLEHIASPLRQFASGTRYGDSKVEIFQMAPLIERVHTEQVPV